MEVTTQKPAGKLLIVDDDADIRELLGDVLSPEFHVQLAADAESGLLIAGRIRPDLILVDLRMPGLDGFGFCSELRSRPELGHIAETLVMVMTGSENAEIRAFESGADDYIQKPFGWHELRARILARLRARYRRQPAAGDTQVIRSGNLELDLDRCLATVDGKPIELSSLEFKLLSYFVRSGGKVVSRAEVLEDNWPGVIVTNRTVDTHVSKIRKAISGSQEQIQSIYGAGYCWRSAE
jgi:DNA-binding response OmpR family regulator